MPLWLIGVGAGYLAVSSAFLLAMARAAARGDRHLVELPPSPGFGDQSRDSGDPATPGSARSPADDRHVNDTLPQP